MDDLESPASWANRLGLLPVPLEVGSRSYVLVNGSRGNFCLSFSEDSIRPPVARSRAWSCNVGHYVTVKNSEVVVQRWDHPGPSRYPQKQVEDQLEQFHRTLESNEPHPDASIIAHFLRVFGSLRSLLGSEVDGQEALGVFLVLIASACEKKSLQNLDARRLGLNASALDLSSTIAEKDWAGLNRDLLQGRNFDGLEPDLGLVLRHASGLLFQEAHYAALYGDDGQLYMGGFLPPPVALSKPPSSLGLHFTPPVIARSVIEEVIRGTDTTTDTLTILDPACGSGEFLREAYRLLRLKEYTGKVRAIGYDISRAAVNMAMFSLTWEKRSHGDDPLFEFDITHQDSLAHPWSPADIILMNPPFLSWKEQTSSQRDLMREMLGHYYERRPDMAVAFLWKASQRESAHSIGSIVPAVFFKGASYNALRSGFLEAIRPQTIAKLGSHTLFFDAKVDAGFLVGHSGLGANSPTTMIWCDHRPRSVSEALRTLRRIRSVESALPQAPHENSGYSIYDVQLEDLVDDWAPKPYSEWKLLSTLNTGCMVKDIFVVRQGILTGANDAFILEEIEFRALPKSERVFFRPATVNESILDGRIHEPAYVFYPYGKYEITTEHLLKRSVPTYYRERLKTSKKRLLQRARTSQESWWLLSEHRAWQVDDRPKIISTYFGGIGSFAWDKEGGYAVLQGYAWLPRWKARKNAGLGFAYLALLNSPIFFSLVKASSVHVGGGQWNLSKRYVNGLPLPRLDSASISADALEVLVRIGRSISADGLSNLSKDQTTVLQETASEVYGIAELVLNE